MEIKENPRTFSVLVTEQELRTLTQAVESWMDTATAEDTEGETLDAMWEQLRNALEEEAEEEEEEEEEEEAEEEEAEEKAPSPLSARPKSGSG